VERGLRDEARGPPPEVRIRIAPKTRSSSATRATVSPFEQTTGESREAKVQAMRADGVEIDCSYDEMKSRRSIDEGRVGMHRNPPPVRLAELG